jgi:hypothetical protein
VGITHAAVMFAFLLLIGGYVTASIVSRPRRMGVPVSPPP